MQDLLFCFYFLSKAHIVLGSNLARCQENVMQFVEIIHTIFIMYFVLYSIHRYGRLVIAQIFYEMITDHKSCMIKIKQFIYHTDDTI